MEVLIVISAAALAVFVYWLTWLRGGNVKKLRDITTFEFDNKIL